MAAEKARPLLLLMEDGSHAEIVLCGAKRVLNLGQLDVGIPDGLRVGLLPVGTEDVGAPCFQRPLISFLVLLDTLGDLADLDRNRHKLRKMG